MGNSLGTVLIVDDEPAAARLLVEHLRDAGYTAEFVLSATDALAVLSREPPVPIEVLVVDYMMSPMSGVELVETLREHLTPPVVVVATGYPLHRVRTLFAGLPVVCFVDKNDPPSYMIAAVARAVEASRAMAAERAAHVAVRASARKTRTLDLSSAAQNVISRMRGPR